MVDSCMEYRPEQQDTDEEEYRITFLVNIWTKHRPANVQELNDDIRQEMIRESEKDDLEDPLSMELERDSITPIQMVGGQSKKEMIELAFDETLVLRTLPPPPFKHDPSNDTLVLEFDPDLHAYLEATTDDEDDEESYD